ncbi:MAG: MBL fold metallo-hydrolase [Thermogemmatispora sp.]|uniref:MBL fold metallo-hydrolase n=1 Tax=Thermogemmatispora sp. TaxID=1968838 RepID=UPI002624A52D|nr:MBL fold metallo-hydrolase [Thermogemmatispora sp.]MBX5456406.1 MBL fold metallo-hydrolase [Thermogemmatispora sp.]
MRVISLGSGSSGNAVLIEAGPNGRTRLLVDAGLPCRTLINRLHLAGVSPAQILAVLLTHEHNDHTLALPTLLKRYDPLVISDPATLAALVDNSRPEFQATAGSQVDAEQPLSLGLREKRPAARQGQHRACAERVTTSLPLRRTLALSAGSSCLLGDVEIVSFPVPHDAAAPCGYLLSAGGCRVCVVVDSGSVTPIMLEAMRQADLLILEANHDRERLLRGPYTYALKMRILSPTGHLSNEQAAQAILQTWRTDGLRWIWLAHLSQVNNTPQLALRSVQRHLLEAGAALQQVHLAPLPRTMGPAWDSTRLWHDEHWWRYETLTEI